MDVEQEVGSASEHGAKMGQTIRQTMPFNAHYAFMQAGRSEHITASKHGALGPRSPHTPAQLVFGLVLAGSLVMGDSRFGRGCRLLIGNRSVINQWI